MPAKIYVSVPPRAAFGAAFGTEAINAFAVVLCDNVCANVHAYVDVHVWTRNERVRLGASKRGIDIGEW